MANPQLFTVSFGGDTFTIVQDNLKNYIHLQPLIDNKIGLSWKRQLAKLRDYGKRFDWRDYVCDGQVYHCIALDDLAAFLGTINPSSVSPGVRKRLLRYKNEVPGQIRRVLLDNEASGDNALLDLLRSIGFGNAVLRRMGLVAV